MKKSKQIGLYFALVAILALLLALLFPSFFEDCLTSALTGRQRVRYAQTAVNGEGQLMAVGRQDDSWRLVRGDSRGRDDAPSLKSLGITDVVAVHQLCALADGGALLAVYEQKEDLLCRAYYVAPGAKTAQMIASAVCAGGSMQDARLSGFDEEGGAVAFLLEQGTEMAVFGFTPGDESARKLKELTAEQAETTLFARTDGSAVLTEGDLLVIRRDRVQLPASLSPVAGWRLEDGACLLDGSTGALWRVRTDSGKVERLLTLDPTAGLVDLSVSADGRVALLTESGELQLWRDNTLTDHTGLLYRPRWQSVAYLVLAVLAVLLGALVLWYILCELRRMQLSLVVRYGVTIAVLLALLTASAVRFMVRPHYESQARSSAETYLRTAALSAPEPVVDPLGADWDFDASLTTRAEYVYALWRAFGSPQVPVSRNFEDVAPGSPYEMAVAWALRYHVTAGMDETHFGPDQVLTDEQAFTFLYRAMRYIGGDRMTLAKQGQNLYAVRADGGKTALSALLLGDSFREAALTALDSGTAFTRYTDSGADCFATFSRAGADRITVISTGAELYQAEAARGVDATARLLWIAALVVMGLVLVILAALSRSLRRVTRGMTAIQNGAYVEVVDLGGDEVSAMADSLNTMARSLRDADAQELRRGDVYARFLPGRITDLLEVPSVESIDKQTFASREMTTMHVSFTFDEQVYESRSKELFDNINEVTERAAGIISAQGGMILSFAHNGFDALFDPDSSAPVSAAVAIRQEIIAVNRERSRRQLSPVTLHITLDSGEVLLGVVGDEKRMQATAISSSFNTARMLDALFNRFEANILCTERIEHWTEGYGSRYIGKTHDGSQLIRVYEIYDGDPYTVRQGKAESDKAFSEGVYTLYSGDYAAAKRIFMEIVRRNSGDGAARHYLYLADRFEKEPPEEVCLDF
ncbi:MAG: HAMP domain-containing protein [Clostridia bacterium]|nr:HAMP domain-containing protein [Clostridia bacterium]